MDVAGDYLNKHQGKADAKRVKLELQLIKSLEMLPIDSKEKCYALWDLIKEGRKEKILETITRNEALL